MIFTSILYLYLLFFLRIYMALSILLKSRSYAAIRKIEKSFSKKKYAPPYLWLTLPVRVVINSTGRLPSGSKVINVIFLLFK